VISTGGLSQIQQSLMLSDMLKKFLVELSYTTNLELNCIFTLLQVLQNLGKADRTTDDDFLRHVAAFNDQQVMIS